jgi:hypothetical protein
MNNDWPGNRSQKLENLMETALWLLAIASRCLGLEFLPEKMLKGSWPRGGEPGEATFESEITALKRRLYADALEA